MSARECFRADGAPKKAYPTGAKAEEAALRMGWDGREVYWPYRCQRHGWHIGRRLK